MVLMAGVFLTFNANYVDIYKLKELVGLFGLSGGII